MKIRLRYILILIGVSVLGLASCRKDSTIVFNPEDPYYKDYKFNTLAGQWDYIWHVMDNQYVFWDIDSTDWDALYNKLYVRFDNLDKLIESFYMDCQNNIIPYPDFVDSTETVISDFLDSDFSQALGTLADQHMHIKFYNRYAGQSHSFWTSSVRLVKRSDYHPSITHSVAVKDNPDYSGIDYIYDGIVRNYNVEPHFESSDDESLWAYSCILEDGIVYMRTGACQLSDPEKECDIHGAVYLFLKGIMDMNDEGTLNGIVLDFRGNTGGNAEDLKYLPGMFIDMPFYLCKQRTKKGLGRYDYTQWKHMTVKPYDDDDDRIDIGNTPFVVLQDMHSASLGELTGYAFSHCMPTAVTIGERSMGATGMLMPTYPDVYHAGTANYNGDVSIYTSTFDSRYYNRENGCWESFEGIGFEPDIYCPLDYDALVAGGRDTQLDRAVEYIRSLISE